MKAASDLLEWARANENVRIVTTPIPNGVLPPGIDGKIHDVKVFIKRESDDELYNKHPDLRKLIARGHCFIELDHSDGTKTIQCVIRALKKFTGNDDRDVCWKEYFSKPISETVDIVCTSKTNGEAAHLGSMLICDQIYICAGSKNVHMLFKNKTQLQMYELDNPRYTIAKEICEIVLIKFDIASNNKMYNFMLKNRCMAVMEYLCVDHPHIVMINETSLKFIAWTSCCDNNTTLVSMRPDYGIELAKTSFNCDTIDYKVIEYSEFDEHVKEIHKATESEGEVMYFVDKDDVVIGLLKKKTVWYVIIRAIREKLRHALKHTLNVDKLNKTFHKKLVDTEDWLKFDDFDNWYTIASSFFAWLHDQQSEHGIDTILRRYNNEFPLLYDEFSGYHSKKSL
jgi:hypothetical protein